jgi:hypothetical protein
MNADHERTRFLREQLASERRLTPELAAQLEQPWRSNGVVARVVFFLLTCGGYALFYGLLSLLRVPRAGVVAAVGAIAFAEYLIGVKRWFGTGVEEALWIGGTISLISALPNSGRPEGMLVIAAALAIPGARLRNALFGAIAAGFVAQYAEARADLGTLVALLFATAALFALLRTWRRPSTEWLAIAIALLLPVWGRFNAGSEWRTITIALYAAFAAIALVLALWKRHHALFLAAMVGGGIAATDFAARVMLATEAKLAIAGSLLLAVSIVVMRALRGNTRGFVLTPAKLTPFDEEMQLAATLVLKPDVKSSTSDGFQGGDGSFGGAGATGEF